ncbi:MAG: SpoIIE family protein phosphatase [Clostridia bacterium]|nr:SpoIIE family protein phosphatase [Clostridia bacterium]
MKKLKIYFDYDNVIKYLFLSFGFLFLNKLGKIDFPYGIALFTVAINFNFSILVSALLFLSSVLFLSGVNYLLSSGFSVLFISVIIFIYKKSKVKCDFKIVPYSVLSFALFLIIFNTAIFFPYETRLISVGITVLLEYLFLFAFNIAEKKGLKYKLASGEFAILGSVIIVFGVGLSNLTSPLIYKSIAIVLILLVGFIYKVGYSSLISSCLGITLFIYYGNIEYISVFLLFGIVVSLFNCISIYLSAFGIVVVDLFIGVYLQVYPAYFWGEFIATLSGCILFLLIPPSFLSALKEKLYSFREKQLSRQSINRNRLFISNRLYEISDIFSDIGNAFGTLIKNGMSADKTHSVVLRKINATVCESCNNRERCENERIKSGKEKLVEIGLSKGKISLIDFPKSLCENCIKPNDVLFMANKMINEYTFYLKNNENIEKDRKLLKDEAEGVSKIIKSLALETGTMLKFQNKAERVLSKNLLKNGFPVSELLIYGEGDNVVLTLILDDVKFNLKHLLSTIKKTLNLDLSLTEKNNITENKVYLSFRKTPTFDAVFGISSLKKDCSDISGDTHSVLRIKEDKFLVALSDGMGSGDYANKISSVSLSLIESFYKAGIDSEVILNTVNKLLSFNTEDTFTALDIVVIDLRTLSADFIKYGSPYGFILGEDGIKIIEGNTLPLGILSEINPSVCSSNLYDGDIVVLLSDGVSEAFGSNADLIDFLKTQPALNPQTLADNIIERAITISKGVKKDDMTALCVRLFKREELPA